MTEDQVTAIAKALTILHSADIPSEVITMYGTDHTKIFLSLPGVKPLGDDDE